MLRKPIQTLLLVVSTALGLGLTAGVAQAGIIVIVGRPSPELCKQDSKKQSSYDGRRMDSQPSTQQQCVQLPDGELACARSIRVDTVNVLPKDWSCVSVDARTLFCEVPGLGAAPGAAGYGEFDAELADEDFAADEEIQALGCEGGAGPGALLGLLGLGLVALRARRRTA